jgi:hypothetical protein
MADRQHLVRSGIASIMTACEPDIDGLLEKDPSAHLRLISLSAEIASEVSSTLRSSVEAGRAAGLSWEQIGDALHISRQAAQQRFGRAAPEMEDGIVRMSPVTAFDEIERLNEAGKRGWHSIGFGALYHDLAPSGQQWEHRRVSIFAPRQELEAAGWQKIGTMWFPWAYYARPTGAPALLNDTHRS